jgi:beta-glucosidase
MINDHSPVDLTLHQKASLGSGASFWRTKTVAGLPAAILTDGPHGVRAQVGAEDHLGIAPSAPATCFPPAAGLAQSWDPQLVERVGRRPGRRGPRARCRRIARSRREHQA